MNIQQANDLFFYIIKQGMASGLFKEFHDLDAARTAHSIIQNAIENANKKEIASKESSEEKTS